MRMKNHYHIKGIALNLGNSKMAYYANLATERKRQLTTARANQTTGSTNGTAANWAPGVEFSPSRSVAKSAYYVCDVG